MTYASEVLADSPWGYWKCDETSGTSLADSSGNSRALTITGSPTLNQSGPDTGVPSIDWPSSAVTEHYASGTTLAPTTCTAEAWVYLTATPTTQTPIMGTAAAYGNNTQRIQMSIASTGKVEWLIYQGGATATAIASASALSLNTWHHVVCSIGAATQKIRIDKATSNSTAGTSVSSGTESIFVHGGGNSGGATDFTNGGAIKIARPAFYTTQLSDARADAHFDAMGPEAGPITVAGEVAGITVAALDGTALVPVLIAGEVANVTVAAQDGLALVPVVLAGETAAVTVAAYDGTLDVGVADPIVLNGEVAAVVVTAYDGTLTYVAAGEVANVTVTAYDGAIAGAPTILVGDTADISVDAYAGTLQIVHSAKDTDLTNAGTTNITGWGTVDYDPPDPDPAGQAPQYRQHIA